MESREQTQMDRQHIFAINGTPKSLDILRELLQGERYNVTMTNFLPNTFDQIAALDPALLIIDRPSGAGPDGTFLSAWPTRPGQTGFPSS